VQVISEALDLYKRLRRGELHARPESS
jgi:hypothetical protein